jgi:hypothetical protein
MISDADVPEADVSEEVPDLAAVGTTRNSLTGTTLDDTRTAVGGCSSQDAPDESLKNI